MMPGMSGDDVIRELQRIGTTTPIVLTSGYDAQELSQRFAGRGVAAFLQKPYQSATSCAPRRSTSSQHASASVAQAAAISPSRSAYRDRLHARARLELAHRVAEMRVRG